jgi:hypothetical protein
MLEKILHSTYRCWIINNGKEQYYQNDADVKYAELLKPSEKDDDQQNPTKPY